MSTGLGRFFLAGCGSIGSRHLGNLLRAGVTDIVVFDEQEERRRKAAERWGVETTDHFEAGLEGSSVVLLCTPTHLHIPGALAAARAGCHLFIEKPLGHALDCVHILEEEVARRGLRTLIGCNFRFHPAMRELKRLVEDGVAGRLISVRAQFGQHLPDWHPWEDYRQSYSARREMGGGVVLDRIHELDYVRWLMGNVREVCALAGHLSNLEISSEDTAEVLLRFESGAFGSVHMDYVRRDYDCRLEIVGDEGTLEWSYKRNEVSWFSGRDRVWRRTEWPNYDPNDMYMEQMRHFLAIVEGLERSVNDLGEARRVLEMAIAVKRSSVDRVFIGI